MHPIKTARANVVYRGDGQTVGDVWVEREAEGRVLLTYELDDADRAAIAAGGRLELAIYAEPIPPVSLAVIAAELSEPAGPHPGHPLDVDTLGKGPTR